MRRRFLVMVSLALIFASVVLNIRGGQAGASTFVGPKANYLALGDSLAYGYQPNLHIYSGYADQWFSDLRTHGTTRLVNLGCPDETSGTFINGGCPYAAIVKVHHTGPQLSAALSFIKAHPGQVSPVTIDIGANDILPLINSSSCSLASTQVISAALTTFDSNYVTILTKLKAALNGTGDLLTMNYYFPFQNTCPQLVPFFQTANQHLVNDAAQVGVPLVDVFSAFGGPTTPNPNICSYTWMCSSFADIHPTTKGYDVIAAGFAATAGY